VGVLVKITPHDFLVMAAMVALMSAGMGFMLGRAMVAMVLRLVPNRIRQRVRR
jgi:lipid-binding SYLF domain-containing protein